MGKLNLLHHKSYHPYKAENIERVRRDEAKAKGEELEIDRRMMLADSEARLGRLRKKGRKDRDGTDEGEKALERQLKGLKDVEVKEDRHPGTVIIRPDIKGKGREEVPSPMVEMEGKHINFWSEFEAGAKTTLVNPEVALEKALEKEQFESLTKMYLTKKGEDIQGWYASQDGKTEKERKEGVDKGLERAYKDGEHKRLSDPLALMKSYLQRRSDVINNVPRPRTSSSSSISSYERYPTGSATPETQRGDLSPIITSLLAPRRRKGDPIPPSAPPAPRSRPTSSISSTAHVDPKQEASSRVSSERARAAALIASKRQGSDRSGSETPKSEWGATGYGMFNRQETKEAREAKMGWGERKMRRDERERGYGGGGGGRGSRGW